MTEEKAERYFRSIATSILKGSRLRLFEPRIPPELEIPRRPVPAEDKFVETGVRQEADDPSHTN